MKSRKKEHRGREVLYQEEKHATPAGVFCLLALFAVIVSLILFIFSFPCRIIKVKGNSMEPAVCAEDYAVCSRMVYVFRKPERFDVIAFSSPKDGETSVKRIVGLPGETVEIGRGCVMIDGEPLETGETLGAYYRELSGMEKKVVLGEDEYYVLGDALSYSEDSRSSQIGAVKYDRIIGKVWLRYSPPFSFASPGA